MLLWQLVQPEVVPCTLNSARVVSGLLESGGGGGGTVILSVEGSGTGMQVTRRMTATPRNTGADVLACA